METLKKLFLSGFVIVCVILIVVIWVDGLAVDQSSSSTTYLENETPGSTIVATQLTTPFPSPLSSQGTGLTGHSQTPDATAFSYTETPVNQPTPNLTQTWIESQNDE